MDDKKTQETKVGEGPVKATLKLDPTTKLVLGREIGGYLIQGELGRGGMAMVYRALDKQLDRAVAIKVLPLHMATDEEFASRFEREARSAAKLDHPNVVQIFAAGRSEEILYIAMQFVEGSSLSDVLHSRRVGMREAIDIVRQTALALDAAHTMGIVHRDIKPSNIMIQADGKVKVMDFGLAKAGRSGSAITQTGTYLGTPEYSSPEQCETRDVDGRSDVYSLGVVLYEMLAGTLPHVAETPLGLFKKIVEERPIPIEELNRQVPRSVRQLLERMLEKNPAKRMAAAADVAAAAERILRSEKLPEASKDGVAAKDLPVISGRIPVGRKRQSRRIAGVAGVALAAAGILLAGMVMFPPTVPTGNGDGIVPPDGPGTPVSSVTTEQGQVIVFDFKNGNPKAADAPEHEWLEVGITEMLIANLSQHPGLKVMLRDDFVHEMHDLLHKKVSLADGGDAAGAGSRVTLNEDTRKLVIRLNARWILSGSFFVQEKTKLRILAQLYRIGDGERLQARGSFTVSGETAGAFELVDEHSRPIMAKLSPAPETTNPDARIAGRPGRVHQEGTAADPAASAAPGGPAPKPNAVPADSDGGLAYLAESAEVELAGCENVILNAFQSKNREVYGFVSESRRKQEPLAHGDGGREWARQQEAPHKEAHGQVQGEGPADEPPAAVAGRLRSEKSEGQKQGVAVAADAQAGGAGAGDDSAQDVRKSEEKNKPDAIAGASGSSGAPGSDLAEDKKSEPEEADRAGDKGASGFKGGQRFGGKGGSAAASDPATTGGPADGNPSEGGASQIAAGGETNAGDRPVEELEKMKSQYREFLEQRSDQDVRLGKRVERLRRGRGAAADALVVALQQMTAQRGAEIPKQVLDRVSDLRGQMTAQILVDDRDAPVCDAKESFRIYCTVRKHLEDLTPADTKTTSENVNRLRAILARELPVDEMMFQIETMFLEAATDAKPESATEPAEGSATPPGQGK